MTTVCCCQYLKTNVRRPQEQRWWKQDYVYGSKAATLDWNNISNVNDIVILFIWQARLGTLQVLNPVIIPKLH